MTDHHPNGPAATPAGQPSLSPNHGLECLLMIARFHQLPAAAGTVAHEHDPDSQGLDEVGMTLAARSLGMRAQPQAIDFSRLERMPLPCAARDREGTWVVLAKHGMAPGRPQPVTLVYGLPGKEEYLDRSQLEAKLEGRAIMMTPRGGDARERVKFSLAWFKPFIVKHRMRIFEILLATLVVNLLGLVTPLGFQVAFDKVLPHHAFETLATVLVVLGLATVATSLLSYLRDYFTAHLGCRLDASLGARMFAQIMGQPLAYFQERATGAVVQRLREIDALRAFLMNGLITAGLDAVFVLIYLWVLWFYSSIMTLAVLMFLIAYVAVAVAIAPVLRQRVRHLYEIGASNQAYAVETVRGIRTVKASAQEPRQQRNWEDRVSSQARANFDANNTGSIGSNIIQGLNQAKMVALLGLGVHEVISGDMSMGAFIAFNMIAQQITQPIMRLAQLWQGLQEMQVALQRAKEVMESPTEDDAGWAPSGQLRGEVEFRGVTFNHAGREQPALRDVSFHVPAGTVVGVIGRSGSGKSTLGFLLQRFMPPNEGAVLIDDYNLAELQPQWLRPQLGVVLQDNLLFNGTIKYNIAHANPGMPSEQIKRAAELAGADDFIRFLDRTYETEVGEGGEKLSGGQRQRIALARALASDPRLLILDEITSGLDAATAEDLLERLPDICAGRTVFLITHNMRLLERCDRALLLDNGRLLEYGTLAQLRASGGKVARLLQGERL